MDSLITTTRSNKVATCLGIQDVSQLRKDYGREQADVIMNITGKSSSPGNRRKPKSNCG